MLKAMGYAAGTPDLLIFEPRWVEFMPGLGAEQMYHGLFIELKREKGQLSPNQAEFMHKLDDRRYKTYVCYGYEAAIKAIDTYMKGK